MTQKGCKADQYSAACEQPCISRKSIIVGIYFLMALALSGVVYEATHYI
ncbi:MAG: hypothetical protein ABFE02_12640 [Sulfuricella sp.]